MSDASKAVFLSYASQDAEAARRICEALRSGGVDVWFDVEGGLEHGDEWDTKIRRQIKECVLFIPLISADTQARHEGYFRLEWDMAAERARSIASGVPFILPVVIDDTREPDALVPDRFRMVQWTRLPGGVVPADVQARFMKLWAQRTGGLKQETASGGLTTEDRGRKIDDGADQSRGRKRNPAVLVLAILALLAIAALAIWQPWQRSDSEQPARPELAERASSPDKSVAVLAFADLSDDKNNEYFSDGISEELLNVLAKVPGMRVTARSSSFYFKGRNVPVNDVAQQLGVAYVVEGSVRKQGDRVRISAQLIKASDGFNVWSDTFNRDLKDIFAVQDEIAGLIAEQMQLKLGVTQRAQVVNPEAHRLLLEARFYWNQRGEQNFDRTEGLLNQALAIDPTFAPAHAAMADLWAMRAAYRATEGLSDVSTELRALQASATQALELDPALVEPYSARAYGLMMEGKWDESEQWFGRALALRPDDSTVRFWRAILLMNRGDFATAAGEFEDARRLDPFSFAIAQLDAECVLTLRRTTEAIELLKEADELRPGGFLPAQGKRAALLWQAGQNEEAVALARKVRQSWPAGPRWDADAQSLWVLKQSGLEDEVAAYSAVLLRELPADSVQRGWVLSVLDRVDEALPFLEHLSSLNRFYLANTPLVDSWRDDPRFRELLRRLNWESEYERARIEMPGAVSKP